MVGRMTEDCYGVLHENPYSVTILVVRFSDRKKMFGFDFTGDSHRWVDFCKETAERLAGKEGLRITTWESQG
jgi:hypothetical protein